MPDFDDVLHLTGARRIDLTAWIEEEWVLPARDGDTYHFTEADVARVRLIVELRHDLRIGVESLPVVLALLDQVYALRRTVRNLGAALQELPEPERQRVRDRLGWRHDERH